MRQLGVKGQNCELGFGDGRQTRPPLSSQGLRGPSPPLTSVIVDSAELSRPL